MSKQIPKYLYTIHICTLTVTNNNYHRKWQPSVPIANVPTWCFQPATNYPVNSQGLVWFGVLEVFSSGKRVAFSLVFILLSVCQRTLWSFLWFKFTTSVRAQSEPIPSCPKYIPMAACLSLPISCLFVCLTVCWISYIIKLMFRQQQKELGM